MKVLYLYIFILSVVIFLLLFIIKYNNIEDENSIKLEKKEYNSKYLKEYNKIIKNKEYITNIEMNELNKCYNRTHNIVCDRDYYPFYRGYSIKGNLTYEVIDFNIGNDFVIKPEKCESDYIITFMTRPEEYYERNVQRKLFYNNEKIKVYYIMMKSDEEKYNKIIEIENYKYNDIVQFSEISSYFNMTVQALRLLKWVDEYCKYKVLIKSDVDVYINYNKLLKYLHRVDENSKKAYGGIVTGEILRDKKYLHRLSNETLPGKIYPPYFIGIGSFITKTSVKEMIKYKDLVKKLWIDDVYFGFLMRKSNITMVNIINKTREKFINITARVEELRHLILIHGLKSSEKLFLKSKLIY